VVNVLGLGVFAQSLLSVGILTFVSYPSMAFAIPTLIWWLTVCAATPPRPRHTPGMVGAVD
jgi:hypothetical protein